jgi:MoaA/NifB/PqqE/SkfB family radical SAM enzyme/glycosyltransferase involved in cell wall biosynthesis
VEAVRVCILTRGDLFPTNHGAAVKIVRTAEHLSLRSGQPCFLVTDDRDHYLRFDGRQHSPVAYPPRWRAAQEWPGLPRLSRLATRLCDLAGYPPEEHFLYRPMFDPAWWLRALTVGLVERIDVFQAEFPGYGVPALVAARLSGLLRDAPVRSSIVQHNVEWDRLEEFGHDVRRIRPIEQGILSAVDEVIAVSTDDRRRMVAAGLAAGRVTVIPHGVDVPAFSRASPAGIRARYGIPEHAPLLFFHGTLHYWPNTEAVRCIAERLLPRLLASRPDLRVLIAGMNPPTYYAHPAITFAGPVPDLPEHIAAADVCICPLTAGGGTRLKLLEYMAAGKPVVSTTKGAEGIQVDGELVLADGIAPFADAVLALLESPSRRAALGHAAGRFARRFDWSAVTAAYTALYRGEGRGADWNTRLEPSIEAHLPPRVPSKPLTLLLLINRGCNLRCSFCDLWEGHEHMPLERLLVLLDQAAAIGTKTLVITGGEPFLHPDLFAAVAAAKARGMAVNITTNGTLIDRRWAELVESGVDSLSFSIDGLEETHDRLRGQKGCWRRTWAAIERVRAAGMTASVYSVATSQNVGELVAIYERARAAGCGYDFWPVNDAPELYITTPQDRRTWAEAVAHIAAGQPAVAGRRAFYAEGLDYHAGALPPGAVRCLGLIDQYGVTYSGELLPCCVWGGEGLVVGNVFQTPLTELWRSEAVQDYRRRLYTGGCSAGCFNHSLYEFTDSTGEPFRL